MFKNKKKLLLVIALVVLVLGLTGCSIPTDENGKYILITLNTTFQDMMQNEGFFSAILVYPLAQFINWLTPYTNVGVSIMLVTLVINSLVLVLTLKQNIQMQAMQALQPELEKIQRKYEGRTDDASRMRQAQEMQNLYAKHKINPMSSFVGLFIQFPILIAMYQAVIRSEAVATGKFLGMSLEISPMDGFTSGQWLNVVVFVLMLVVQVISMNVPQWLAKHRAKLEAEKHKKAYKPTKNPMGNSMYIMMGFIFILMVTWPTAMSFYYMISSFVQIIKAFVVDIIMAKQKESK